jgi:HD-GYP domain-containing protein (c-di-GMP phosphodiesterase class II)
MLHAKNTSKLCGLIAEGIGFRKDKIEQMKITGFMHDIGKIGIDREILTKTGLYNVEDWKEVKRHSEIGYRILNASSEFSEIAPYVLHHHERWDGKGYPTGLKGEEISIEARIITIADAFDAMTSDSTYKGVLSEDEASNEIKKDAGIQFDPEIARVMVEKVMGKKWQ